MSVKHGDEGWYTDDGSGPFLSRNAANQHERDRGERGYAAQELADAEALIDTQSKALVQGVKQKNALEDKVEKLEAFVQSFFMWYPHRHVRGVEFESRRKLEKLAETVRYVTELAPKPEVME